MTTAEILLRLDHVVKISSGWTSRCPAHDDHDPSLSIATGADDRIILHCHAGCTPENVCAAIGITLADLFADRPERNGAPRVKPTPDEAARNAARIYADAKPVSDHPYLRRKGVKTHPAFREADGMLIVPLHNEARQIRALQRLWPDGSKKFSDGSKVKGLYFVVSEEPDGPLLLAEGLATALSLFEATGFAVWMALNCGNFKNVASIARRRFGERDILVCADNDGKNGVALATTAAKAIGGKLAVPKFADGEVEGKDFNDLARLDGLEAVKQQVNDALAVQSLTPEPGNGDDLQRAINDPRPKIRLPGPDRLLSDFAVELADAVHDKDIYLRNGEVVTLADNDLKPISPQAFRCWAERFFIGYRAKTIGENSFQFDVTMSDNEARGTLAAPQFRDRLRRVRRVNRTRLPIIGKDGKLTMLPDGYHDETETLTLADTEYDQATPLVVAVETINDLLAEFRFADSERSKAVSIAGMVSVFAAQLSPEKSLRPCFIFIANAEGAGKTLLAQICVVPTLGAMPIASKADDDDEMRKALITAIREALLVLFFDNIKGKLSSEPLEAFLSAPVYGGRKLGVNENVTGDNLTTVFCTGNGMTVSPDMRRRSLFVELHLEVERAEDRKFSRVLDMPRLLAMRPKILAALWAMVRHWDENGRPAPSCGHSAFPTWANIVGGIVEAAGFTCPLKKANVTATADPDGEDMRSLVKEMASDPAPLQFSDLVNLAHEHGLFTNIIGESGDDLGRREKSAFGRLLARYDNRLVSDWRFIVEGKGHARRYRIQPLHGDMVGHGVSDEKTSLYTRELGPKDHADHADHE
jgi:hypothetical protein